jgi:hypothetical protein
MGGKGELFFHFNERDVEKFFFLKIMGICMYIYYYSCKQKRKKKDHIENNMNWGKRREIKQ